MGAVGAAAGDLGVPGGPLAISLLVVGEAVIAQQTLAHVGNVGFDLALGLGTIGAAEAQLEAVVVGAGQGLGVVETITRASLGADMGAHDRLGAVVEDLLRDSAEVGEGGSVAGPEGDQILGADQPDEGIATVTQHHVEAVERQLQPRGGAGRLLMGAVDLGLMAGRRLKAFRDGLRCLRAGAVHVVAHRRVAAGEAVVATQVLVDARRP